MALITAPPTHSIVEYFYPPDAEGHRCGYCKSSDTNFSHGMWAHTISPENYEHLINLGWRRSGSYLYKPMNEKLCGPMYTIRNLCTGVEVSRSQRKVLKRFRRYLVDGVKGSGGGGGKVDKFKKGEELDGDVRMNEEFCEGKESKMKEEEKLLPTPPVGSQSESANLTPTTDADANRTSPSPPAKTTKIAEESQAPAPLSSGSKAHPLKKKHLRRERKRQKLLAAGRDPTEFFRRNERNRVAELASFFNPENPLLQFSTKLVSVDSPEFQDKYFAMEHKLYQKYQMATHGDTEEECRQTQFKRFLCDNPFDTGDENEIVELETTSSTPRPGTYHQHYYISSNLIAFGVIDILPHCVSSVYFFYDPEYSFLSPGTLGALHEISFVNELHKTNPLMEYYYLGFYIHSCKKMAYKGKFRPCQLLCPVTYAWVPFGVEVRAKLDQVNGGFLKLNEDGTDSGDNSVNNVMRVLIIQNRRVYRFPDYPHKTRNLELLTSYAKLVGPFVAGNMLLYVSSSTSK